MGKSCQLLLHALPTVDLVGVLLKAPGARREGAGVQFEHVYVEVEVQTPAARADTLEAWSIDAHTLVEIDLYWRQDKRTGEASIAESLEQADQVVDAILQEYVGDATLFWDFDAELLRRRGGVIEHRERLTAA